MKAKIIISKLKKKRINENKRQKLKLTAFEKNN